MAVISIFRIVSLSSVVAAIGLPLLMALGGSSAYGGKPLIASLMVLWRHRSNIERLIAYCPKIGQKARPFGEISGSKAGTTRSSKLAKPNQAG